MAEGKALGVIEQELEYGAASQSGGRTILIKEGRFFKRLRAYPAASIGRITTQEKQAEIDLKKTGSPLYYHPSAHLFYHRRSFRDLLGKWGGQRAVLPVRKSRKF